MPTRWAGQKCYTLAEAEMILWPHSSPKDLPRKIYKLINEGVEIPCGDKTLTIKLGVISTIGGKRLVSEQSIFDFQRAYDQAMRGVIDERAEPIHALPSLNISGGHGFRLHKKASEAG